MELAALGAFLGWLMNRQSNAYQSKSYVCRGYGCHQFVRYDKRQKDFVHPDGQVYAIVPPALEGLTATRHPALPAINWEAELS